MRRYFRFNTCPTLFSFAAQQLAQQSKLMTIPCEGIRAAAQNLVDQQKGNKKKKEVHERIWQR